MMTSRQTHRKVFQFGRDSFFIQLLCIVILTVSFTAAVEEDNDYHREKYGESWLGWLKRKLSQFFSSGEKSGEDRDPPDPNEGWTQWSKRQACKVSNRECCLAPDIRTQTFIPNLKKTLEKEFFGQHIATEYILYSIAAHWKGDPQRPLVLSFHGWSGSGKTYLTQHIAKTLFRLGESSKFYKHFTQGFDFHDVSDSTLPVIQAKLHQDLLDTAERCEYALFVFDEVNQIPPKVLDALVPFIDHPGIVKGVNFRKAIFIFLGNMGATEITNITYENWKAGKSRESLTINDFESILSRSSFNEKGSGLYHSKTIDKFDIDFHIPFLPMEKKHVKMCVEREAIRQDVQGLLNTEVIASNLDYWPNDTPLFSKSGCKKVEKQVALWKAKHYPDKQERVEL